MSLAKRFRRDTFWRKKFRTRHSLSCSHFCKLRSLDRDAGIRNQVKESRVRRTPMAKSTKKTSEGRRGFLKTAAAFVAAAPVAAESAQAPAAAQDWLSLT